MLQDRIIPVLLLQHNKLVKTVQFSRPVYIGDPINTIRIFNEKQAGEIIVLDITPAAKPNLSIITKLAMECAMPFIYGGAIHALDDAKAVFDCGVEKIVLNAAAYSNPALLHDIANAYGSQALAIAIDVKKVHDTYNVFIHNGKLNTHKGPVEYAQLAAQNGAGELFLNSIDRDGTYTGYDTGLIKEVASQVSIPLIACGGARDKNDLQSALMHGASAAAAGSMFCFTGRHRAVLISYPANNT